jgi:pimeloyl-ACP methyl ester carboxylesterase
MFINKLRKILVIGLLLILLDSNILLVKADSSKKESSLMNTSSNHHQYTIELYNVTTNDGSSMNLTRYVGSKYPSIMLIHGMGCNHKIYDWDENHSLARYLNNDGRDVWMLDLRTHDGDGDFFFVEDSDREYINRYWDFNRTLLKIDVVTAIDFIKNKTGEQKIFLSGHSYGGYLAYAYAEIMGQDDLTGIITTGASPYAMPKEFQANLLTKYLYCFFLGKKAFVRPFGFPFTYHSKYSIDRIYRQWQKYKYALFYENTTPIDIQMTIGYQGDSESAGVWVDMFIGKDPEVYNGDWVDPQTLYDYSTNLSKINIPILFIAGENDPQDPSIDIYRGFQNVSSTIKEFHSFPKHSHLDLLLGDDASTIIFPIISQWMNARIST